MSRSKHLVGAALIALLLASCGTAASRVAVEHDQTDIVFGFTTPPPVKRADAGPQATELPDDALRPFTPKPFATFAPSQPQAECPTPAPNAAISGSAGTSVKGRPKAGTYRYNTKGHVVLRGTKIPIPSPMQLYVRKVEPFEDPSGEAFTYQTIVRIPTNETTSGNWLLHYQVKTSAAGSDPEAGLVLRRIDIVNNDGDVTATYFSALANGLLIAPFPIEAGAEWDSTSVDLAHNKTFQLSGQVLRRETVDVCGTLVQGWHLRTEVNAAGESATIDHIVSAENGGQLISTSITGTYLGVQYDKAVFSAGTLDPEPLPKEFR